MAGSYPDVVVRGSEISGPVRLVAYNVRMGFGMDGRFDLGVSSLVTLMPLPVVPDARRCAPRYTLLLAITSMDVRGYF